MGHNLSCNGSYFIMRSLYCCFNAKVKGKIYCKAGYNLKWATLRRLAKGHPLELSICQHCKDFIDMGEWLGEKGWLN